MMRSSTDPASSMALLRDLMRDDVGLEYAEAARGRSARRASTSTEPPGRGTAQPRDRERAPEPGGEGRSGPGPEVSELPRSRRSWAFLLTVTLVAAVLAVGLVQRRADQPAADAARHALLDRAVAAEDRVTALETSIASARDELAALQAAALADSAEGELLTERIDRLSAATGYTPVTGPGGAVVLDDAEGIERGDTTAPGRVLDSDVQTAVNGLWQAGAEAIAVNGRSLTATTAIRTAGAAILVDFKPLVPPYRVEAIGGPNLLTAYAATSSARALDELVADYGLRVTSTASDQVDLPAATALLPTVARVPGAATSAPSPTTSKGTP